MEYEGPKWVRVDEFMSEAQAEDQFNAGLEDSDHPADYRMDTSMGGICGEVIIDFDSGGPMPVWDMEMCFPVSQIRKIRKAPPLEAVTMTYDRKFGDRSKPDRRV
jgi:hypothetical protein